ncbi:MAG: S8 family serine peptidase, partial [Gammaproteobacteria bacterium]
MLLESVRFARSFLVPVVAGAGNAGVDIADKDVYPCKTEGVICVGSVDGNKMNRFNFGTPVDIWAPTNMRSTVTPESAALDANDFGLDELALFNGTSASTPFVAGVIGLMKSANANAVPPSPPLSNERVLSILQSTANQSPDLKVTKGYVDAYRAVRGLLVNQPPSIEVTSPVDNAIYGWKNNPLFTVNYSDPEVSPANIYRWHGEVVYSSNLDGVLCSSASPPYTCFSTKNELTLGAHTVTATATDAHGATATRQRSINIVNRPPEPHIVRPLTTDSLYSHIPVQFGAYVPDPDGETIPEASVSWASSNDGFLATGRKITRN